MKEIDWYFPKSLEEASKLLKQDGIIPHGGGTSILRSGLKNVVGLIDVGSLPLKFFGVRDGIIRMGAALTCTEALKNLRRVDPQNILVKAMGAASATPLRNRITLGGSIASFPPWSDLMGPLIALDAEISLIGEKQGMFNVAEYETDRQLRSGTLITGVSFKKQGWKSSYYRATRTHFDYPAFTLSLLLKTARHRIEDIRAVIVGCKGKFKRLVKLEESLRGKSIPDVKVEGIGSDLDIEFSPKKSLTPVYIKHLACVQIERGLIQALRG